MEWFLFMCLKSRFMLPEEQNLHAVASFTVAAHSTRTMMLSFNCSFFI
jgi:hypothetical protein